MSFPAELAALQQAVEVTVVAHVEGDEAAGTHDGLVPVAQHVEGRGARAREGPEEAAESVYVSALLQRLAHARYL